MIKLIDLQTLLLNKPLNFFQSFYKRQILNMFNFSAVSHTPQVIYTDIMFWMRLPKQSTVYQLHLVPILLFYWIPSYSLTASRLFEFTTCQTRDNTCKYYTVYYYLLSTCPRQNWNHLLGYKLIIYRWQLKFYSVTFL